MNRSRNILLSSKFLSLKALFMSPWALCFFLCTPWVKAPELCVQFGPSSSGCQEIKISIYIFWHFSKLFSTGDHKLSRKWLSHRFGLKITLYGLGCWLTPIISATWEVEIGRIAVGGQHGHKVNKTPLNCGDVCSYHPSYVGSIRRRIVVQVSPGINGISY
jgi:hypothetical protein